MKPKATAQRLFQVSFAPIDELHPDPKNARTHSESQLALLKKSLREWGWYAPIGVARGLVVFGNGRLEAARGLRDEGVHIDGTPSPDEAPIVDLSHLSAEQIKALSLADNRLPELAGWDNSLLAEALGELNAAAFDITSIGFSNADLASLTEAFDPASIIVVPVTPVDDRFWISIRGPLRSQAPALQKLRVLMAEIEGVVVENGTVTDDGPARL